MTTENEIIDFDQIDVYLLNGIKRNNPKELQGIYQKTFKCWYDTWNHYFHGEYETDVKLNSNEFTRQDEIIAIFYKGECFATTFFKEVNWDDETAALDSYFNPWGPEVIEGLTARGKNVLICSQFTVARNFRNRKTDIPWKYILSGFNMKRFLETDCDAMTGTMRVSKGMGRMSVEAGATPLAVNVPCKDHEGELVDIVAFFQTEVKMVYKKNPYHPKFDKVWDRLNGKFKSQWRLVA